MKPLLPACALLLIANAPLALGAAGDLDPTFGTSGIVLTDVTAGGDWAQNGVILPDGRIVACGIQNSGAGFLLLRYQSNGSLDPSFGAGGKLQTAMPGSVDQTRIARQPDGKLVVAGSYFSSPNHFSVVARYDSNGTLDPTFGTGGRVTQQIGPIGDVQGLVIQSNGGIVICGSFRVSGSITYLGLRRYDAAGVLDTGFGVGGTVTRGPGTDNHGYALALQPDGRIVAVGSTDLGGGLGPEMLTFRFKSNGSPDSTFATFGRAITSVSLFPEFAGAVALMPDGRVVVGGHIGIQSSNTHRYAALRFLPDGTLDPNFGSAGITLTPEMGITTGYAFLTGMVLFSSGRMVLCGQATRLGSSDDFAMACLDSTGAMDASFGNGGQVYTDLAGGGRDIANGVLSESDHKLVVLGSAGTGVLVGGPQVGVARYLFDESVVGVAAESARDVDFGLDGIFPNPFGSSTRLSFRLPEEARVRLAVYDVCGREVRVLEAGVLDPGSHVFGWDGRDAGGERLRAGVYLARLEWPGAAGRLRRASVRRLVLLP